MTNIILCGGNGTRLWPISRTLMPKQFAKLFGEKSLFQLTLERNCKVCSQQIIVSNSEQYFLALDQYESVVSKPNTSKFLLEPIARNTAPAIALACLALDREDIVLVTPSDHLIKNEEAYFQVTKRAEELAKEGFIVTFGIAPLSPETGFGYIEADGENVRAFHEKPCLEKAKAYLEAGNYYWNSGMFCFKVDTFLKELALFAPEILEKSQQAFDHIRRDGAMMRICHEWMSQIPEESIDYAVMEKSSKVKVVRSDIAWSDVGSFDALYDEFPKDSDGNTVCKKYVNINSKNNLIISGHRKVSTVDINDLIIVDTPDALLISKRGSSQKVKEVVAELKRRNSDLHNTHLTVHRPWGTYTILENTPGYKIKRIVVAPGKRLSLQKHLHRSEHWIVVSGTATVRVGETTQIVRPNESTYIKMGEVHRLANDGKIPVVLIEAQVGEYTGEDDIVRIEDEYNRL